MHLPAAQAFYARMDAANIDLKGFTDDFYFKRCGGRLQPVLDILAYVRHETTCWLEITTLLIPGLNDGTAELARQTGLHVIASGGVGNLQHLADGVTEGLADAVLAASIFHYGEYTVRQAKEYMRDRGIEVRL